MELRILIKRIKRRVPRTSPSGQRMIGAGSVERTEIKKVLQFRTETGDWQDVPEVIQPEIIDETKAKRK